MSTMIEDYIELDPAAVRQAAAVLLIKAAAGKQLLGFVRYGESVAEAKAKASRAFPGCRVKVFLLGNGLDSEQAMN